MWYTLNLLPAFFRAWHMLTISTTELHATCHRAEHMRSCIANDIHEERQTTAERFIWILSQNLNPSKKRKLFYFLFRLFAETGGRIWPLEIGHVCNELAEAWVKLCVHFLHGILRYTCTF